MRAIGPGSVSSLLKIALDVVYVALWILIGILLVLALAALVVPLPDSALHIEIGGVERELASGRAKMVLFIGLLCAAAYMAVILFVIDRLRRVFATLTMGDPFHPDNVKRLQFIGLGLAGIEAGNIFLPMIGNLLVPGIAPEAKNWPDLTAWFSVLVVFVLAEVFREGARLRRDAELTI